MQFKLAAFLTGLALLTGCVELHKPLSPEALARINKIDVRNMVVQDEMVIRAQSPGVAAAAGGGLIPALIDSAIAKSRQNEIDQLVASFYESAGNYDARATLATAANKLRQLCEQKVNQVVTTPRVMTQDERIELLAAMGKSNGLLNIQTEYTFSPDFQRLLMIARAQLWANDGSSNEPSYQNVLTYESKPLGAGLLYSIQAWSKDAAHPYKSTLEEAHSEVMRMIALDLKCADDKPKREAGGAIHITPMPFNYLLVQTQLTGTVLEENAERMILRNKAGILYSIPK